MLKYNEKEVETFWTSPHFIMCMIKSRNDYGNTK